MLRVPKFRHMEAVSLSSLHNGRCHPQQISLVLISVADWVYHSAIVQPEWLSKWKLPTTESGIEPACSAVSTSCAIAYPILQNIPRERKYCSLGRYIIAEIQTGTLRNKKHVRQLVYREALRKLDLWLTELTTDLVYHNTLWTVTPYSHCSHMRHYTLKIW